ncbi:MAG: type I-E CRISPR-associated protein Cas6/Cse3/CasE [Acidobacteriota bacterium]|jgi:CRISPR system Cascade subunit CasE|nr:type I-E CRISPR-associated protein Cas6/Cse3/CasE [Acidobacteriota bacterium]
MYLSRCELNVNKRGARELLGNPQRMHAAVMSCFPRSMADVNGRVLWRVDNQGEITYLYLVSEMKPDLAVIQEQAGWPETPTAVTKDYSPLVDHLEKGQVFHFRLTANPVKQEFVKGGRGKRVGHKTPEHQISWLVDRSGTAGFKILQQTLPNGSDVPGVDVVRSEQRTFPKRADDGRKVSLRVVTFEGVLEVEDPALMRKTLIEGIGRAKAYGCGLMTLSPIRR